MIDNNFKKIIKRAKGLVLSIQEKEQIKSSILMHMEANPAQIGVLWQDASTASSFFKWKDFANVRYAIPALILVFFVFAGASTFAASRALPGDLLYPLKILGEKVASNLAIGPADKEKVATVQAETRLEEAETLQAQGRLDEEKKATLARSFHQNVRDTGSDEGSFIKKLSTSSRAMAVDITASSSIQIFDDTEGSKHEEKSKEDSHRDKQFESEVKPEMQVIPKIDEVKNAVIKKL
ncbi:MAG: DUF5667 domain-containing protein [Patescibacteria group bacterium]